MEKTNNIQSVLKEIAMVLVTHSTLDISLMEGTPGVVLFLNNYADYSKNENLNLKANQYYNDLIDKINNTEEPVSFTYCDGLVGFLSFCNHFESENGEDYTVNDSSTDEFLAEIMFDDLLKGEYDFLHNALGIFHYMVLKIQTSKTPEHKIILLSILKKALELLEDVAIKDADGYRWDHPVYNHPVYSNKPFFNMGLAHGLPGILLIISSAHLLNIDNTRTERMINQSLKFILNHKGLQSNNVSQFQTYITTESELPYNSRLAWCYGDLSISLAILKAGKALKSDKIIQQALKIALKTLERRSVEDTALIDAEFCHGTAGISHMYGIWYQEQSIKEFNDAQKYWLQETLGHARHPDGLAGFKTYIKDNAWGTDIGMMKGIAGIGLVLISSLTGKRNWDSF